MLGDLCEPCLGGDGGVSNAGGCEVGVGPGGGVVAVEVGPVALGDWVSWNIVSLKCPGSELTSHAAVP